MNRKIKLLDATIRDGGFYNHYDFSCQNIETLVTELETAGIKWIELGHGFGINAENIISPMACTELEYLEAALSVQKVSKLGMFAFPNIATPDKIEKLARIGLNFIRIGFFGIKGTEYSLEYAKPLFEAAKKHDIYISANIVRTQMYTDKELQVIVKALDELHPNCICVVDSPGGALPNQINHQIKIVKDFFNGEIGFHGHQNFTMGIANSLQALASGATFVDGTLKGIGRDSGNTQLELLAAATIKAGYDNGIDIIKLSEFGENFMNSLNIKNGVSLDNIFIGYYNLMTHELDLIKKISKENNLNWHSLAQNFVKSSIKFGTEENISNLMNELQK